MRTPIRFAAVGTLLTRASLAFTLASFARSFAYVANVASCTVSVISARLNPVVKTNRGLALARWGGHRPAALNREGTAMAAAGIASARQTI